MKCESIDNKGNKTWPVIKRESNEFDAGVGLNKYEHGTGLWKYIIGTECKYGIKYFEDANYSVEKCKISEKAYQEFSKTNFYIVLEQKLLYLHTQQHKYICILYNFSKNLRLL